MQATDRKKNRKWEFKVKGLNIKCEQKYPSVQ